MIPFLEILGIASLLSISVAGPMVFMAIWLLKKEQEKYIANRYIYVTYTSNGLFSNICLNKQSPETKDQYTNLVSEIEDKEGRRNVHIVNITEVSGNKAK